MALRVYTVHLPPARDRRGRPLDPLPELVKEGFSWPAFFLGFVWALWKRLWLAAAALIAVELALGILLDEVAAGDLVYGPAHLVVAVFVGMFANDWRRMKLARLGYREAGVVTADDAESALRRYLDTAGAPRPAAPPAAPARAAPWRGPELPTGLGPWGGASGAGGPRP